MRFFNLFLFILGITINSVISIEIRCPTNWVPRAGSSKCYYFSPAQQGMSWQSARDFCQLRSGDLVVIRNVDERNWVTHQAGESIGSTWFWVGLWDPLSNKVWQWVDNSTLNTQVTSWDNNFAVGTCARLKADGKVNKAYCNTIIEFVCEREIDVPILCDSTLGWDHVGDGCFKYMEDEVEWYEAYSDCWYEGADLIIVDSLAKRQYMEDKAKQYKKNIWMGFTNMFDGIYEWVWDKNGNVDNWQIGEPRNGTNNTMRCGLLPYSGNNKWYTENCLSEFPYVCEHAEGNCHTGWTPYRHSCYQWNFALEYSRPWEEAKIACEQQGSKMLVIDDRQEQSYITFSLYDFTNQDVYSRDVWIGLSDVGYKPLEYIWVDGKTPAQKNFTNWLNNIVPGLKNETNCIKLISGNLNTRWIRDSCENIMSFICEAPLGVPIKPIAPTHAPLYCDSTKQWLQFGDYCYKFMKQRTSWPVAQKNCEAISSSLTSITTLAENTWLAARLTSFGHWIGLKAVPDSKQFNWVDGTISNFRNWNAGEPNDGGDTGKPESCVEIIFNFYSTKGRWNDHFCDENKYSICKRKADLDPDKIHTLPPTTPWSAKCGAYWVEDTYTHNCYRYDLERLKWHDARTHCQAYNGDLVSILSLSDQRFVNDLMQRAIAEDRSVLEFWTGFTDAATEGKWKWTDSSPSPYFNWNAGEPNNLNTEDCGTTFANTGRWNDKDCKISLPYICKKSLAKTPIIFPVTYPPTPRPGQRYECKKGWLKYRNECFFFSKDMKTWDEARAECKVIGSGGDLASIKLQLEQTFIQSQLYSYKVNDRLWIGLNDKDVEFEFRWIDGSKVTYTNWMKNEPNHYAGSKEDCVNVYKELTSPGGWNDDICSNKWYYICRTLMQLTDLPSPVPTAAGCKEGYEGYNYACYKFVTNQAGTWNVSNNNCRKLNGELVDILDPYEQAFISGQLSNHGSNFWIGLNSQRTPGLFEWSSGRYVVYSNWNANQPGSFGNCVSASYGLVPGFWKNENCNNLMYSICKVPRTGYVFPTVPTTTASPIKCPLPWKELRNFCFMEIYSPSLSKSFSQARSFCQQYGADLASIHTKSDEDFLIQAFNLYGTYWIGLRSDNGTGYSWVDGSAVQYVNWLKGEPDNHNGVELCVEINVASKGWQDTTCELRRNFICKGTKDDVSRSSGKPLFSTTPGPPVTPAVVCGGLASWNLFQGDCYFIGSNPVDWNKARESCRDANSELVSIKTLDEQRFLIEKLQSLSYTSSMWIGLHALHQHDIYEWSDGSPVGFTNWGKGEPNNYGGAEACGAMYANSGFWNDDNCAKRNRYICRKPNNTASFTIPPTTRAQGNCPKDWYQYGSKCYKLFEKLISRQEARSECMKLSGGKPDLVSIHNELEQTFLISLLQKKTFNIWIGLIDLLSNGNSWSWSDNSLFDFNYWNVGEPGYIYDRRGDCISMSTMEKAIGRWARNNCSKLNGYVCQRTFDPSISTPLPPTPCKNYEGFYQFGANCFYLLNEPLTWANAKDICQRKAGGSAVLASIMTIFEESFIRTFYFTDTKEIWIGLSYDSKSNMYMWTNDQPVLYTKWAKNEPSKGPGEGCVSMMTNGQWDDTSCTRELRGLCKIEYELFSTPLPIVGGTCPNNTKEWIPALGEYCYLYRPNYLKTYGDSFMECQVLRGMLASFNKKNEYDHAMDILPMRTKNMWFGLIVNYDGTFEWLDRSPVSFTNWEPGEPTNGENEKCVDVSPQNTWSDTTCYKQQEFLCQARKIIPNTPSPPTTTRTPTTSTYITSTTPKSLITTTTEKVPVIPESTVSMQTPKAEEVKDKNPIKMDTGATIAIIEATACLLVVLLIIVFIVRRRNRISSPKDGATGRSFDNALYNADDDTVNIEKYNKKGVEYNY